MEFLSKDPVKALEKIKDELYLRMQGRELYAKQDPLKDPYYKGLQKGALSEVQFLRELLDMIERS